MGNLFLYLVVALCMMSTLLGFMSFWHQNRVKIPNQPTIIGLDEKLSDYIIRKDLVSCELCHCLLYKYDAMAGESKIKYSMHPLFVCDKEEYAYMYTPYYCNKCNPNRGYTVQINPIPDIKTKPYEEEKINRKKIVDK